MWYLPSPGHPAETREKRDVCFECLRFRLRLSVNGRMTCAWPNYHLAVQKILHFFIENGRMAIWLDISKQKVFIFLSVNG